MVFSSAVFMFFFLPIVLAVYFLLLRRRSHRNVFLTIASLFFYAWGEPWFVLIMLLSIGVNWLCGLRIGKTDDARARKIWVVLSVIFNLGLLSVFKYTNFMIDNLNWAFGLSLPLTEIKLPIGISFFTFQAMSYVIDVYRGEGKMQRNFLNVCLYISLFPQLIAGPIVRYQTIADEIENRKENMADFTEGCRRFMQGLAKKTILADNIGALVSYAFSLPDASLSVGASWIGAAAYVLQTYFDFSGYSDMAIGLGRMFGFHFLENFNFPMLGRSMSGFWRRWHLSLGSWFRDYLYIPLGGSRVRTPRLILNMMIVWTLTGFWHGADWTFVIWGAVTGIFLVIERLSGLGKWMDKRPIGHLYTLFIIVTISVLLQTGTVGGTIQNALAYLSSMFGFGAGGLWDATATLFVREYGLFFALCALCSLPLASMAEKRWHISEKISQPVRAVCLLAVFAVALSYIIMGSFSPFIYYNF